MRRRWLCPLRVGIYYSVRVENDWRLQKCSWVLVIISNFWINWVLAFLNFTWRICTHLQRLCLKIAIPYSLKHTFINDLITSIEEVHKQVFTAFILCNSKNHIFFYYFGKVGMRIYKLHKPHKVVTTAQRSSPYASSSPHNRQHGKRSVVWIVPLPWLDEFFPMLTNFLDPFPEKFVRCSCSGRLRHRQTNPVLRHPSHGPIYPEHTHSPTQLNEHDEPIRPNVPTESTRSTKVRGSQPHG